MRSINRANTNSLWCSVLVESLARCGLKYVVVSPGSRATPLTVAFASHPGITAVPVLDERSAGFLALGMARRTQRPVALVCTSGTAAVNFFPAVVEASEARVPLLVLTADRPPELRDCGAGQTIDQIRLYGNFPVHQEEMALPKLDLESLLLLKRSIVNAYTGSLEGPVHLNCPFRDPLPPVRDGSTAIAPDIRAEFFDDIQLAKPPFKKSKAPIALNARKGIIICGTEAPDDPEDYCHVVARLSETSGWPVLADGVSPVRNHARIQDHLVTAYDLLIRNSVLRERLKPECVIAIGPLPASKELRKWLSETGAKMYHINRTGKNLDPTGTCVRVLDISHSELPIAFKFNAPVDEDFSDCWLRAQSKAAIAIEARFKDMSATDFEGRICHLLAKHLPLGTPLFVASSMPVRDVEYFWPANDKRIQVHASRGANGIDGTLSTALGMAFENQPSVLLTGDLAFLHDSNGLLIRPRFTGHLTVVLINNQGGGIFNHLPIARFEPPFERFFATPQEVDFKQLVESAGCHYLRMEKIDRLPDFIKELPRTGIRVIEVETDRYKDAEYRRLLFKEVSESLA